MKFSATTLRKPQNSRVTILLWLQRQWKTNISKQRNIHHVYIRYLFHTIQRLFFFLLLVIKFTNWIYFKYVRQTFQSFIRWKFKSIVSKRICTQTKQLADFKLTRHAASFQHVHAVHKRQLLRHRCSTCNLNALLQASFHLPLICTISGYERGRQLTPQIRPSVYSLHLTS